MLKYTDCPSTSDRELFPGFREEKDRKRWLLKKWAFAIMLSLGLVLWSGKLWQTGGEQVQNFAEEASSQGVPQTQFITRTNQASSLGELKTTISDTVTTLEAIPKGTLIPVEIESTQLRGSAQATILARTQSYVFPDKTMVIPAGSEVRGIARRHGEKWEIHWDSVSVLSVGGLQATIQAMNEMPRKASFFGRTLLVKAE